VKLENGKAATEAVGCHFGRLSEFLFSIFPLNLKRAGGLTPALSSAEDLPHQLAWCSSPQQEAPALIEEALALAPAHHISA
jgi:hypothetical protein